METTEARPTDEALVVRLAAGDDTSLAELYDRHAGSLYSLARSIVEEPADAEEIVEDVFIKLWENPAAFSPDRGSVGAFLMVATRSRGIDRIRSGMRRMAAVSRAAVSGTDDLAAPMGRFGVSPDRGAEQSELRDAIRRALALLPEPQRVVLELAYFGGLTHSEIAAKTSEPLGTVKTRIREGMKKLRGVMAPFRTREG